jgi:hypothetical protein
VSTNYRREINLRYLFGAGFTYQIISSSDNWLKISISSEYEQTDFAKANFNLTEYNGVKSISTIRGTIWANGKYELFENKLIANHELYFQPSLEDNNNYRWQTNLGIELPVWKYLNFKINYIHTVESIVIQGQKQVDSMMTFGFTLKSY